MTANQQELHRLLYESILPVVCSPSCTLSTDVDTPSLPEIDSLAAYYVDFGVDLLDMNLISSSDIHGI
jgi:hypothetical protein